jgi:trigger factor
MSQDQYTYSLENVAALHHKVRIDYAIPYISAEITKMVKEFSQFVNVQGFRKGKAPVAKIIKQYGKDIIAEVSKKVNSSAFGEIAREKKLTLSNSKVITDDRSQFLNGIYSFEFEFQEDPVVELADYKNITVKLPRVEVTDEDLNHRLQHIYDAQGRLELADKAATEADFVALKSIQVKLDGEAVTDQEKYQWLNALSDGVVLRVKKPHVTEKLKPSLIGAKAGANIKAEFVLEEQDSFFSAAESLVGKTIEITAEVESVKELVKPSTIAELIAKFGNESMTEEGFTQQLKEVLLQEKQQTRERQLEVDFLDQLVEQSKIEFAEVTFEGYKNQYFRQQFNQITQQAQQGAINPDDLSKAIEKVQEETPKAFRRELVLGKLIAAENIEADHEFIGSQIRDIAQRTAKPTKEVFALLEKEGLKNALYNQATMSNALKFIASVAKIEEVDPEPLQCELHHD